MLTFFTCCYLLLLCVCFGNCSHDPTQFLGPYKMYEGKWIAFYNATNTNKTQIPMLEELNFENPKAGIVQGIVFDRTITMFNVYDSEKLNHIIQLVFQEEDYDNVVPLGPDLLLADTNEVSNIALLRESHKNVTIVHYINTIYKGESSEECELKSESFKGIINFNITCPNANFYLSTRIKRNTNIEVHEWELVSLSIVYCIIVLIVAMAYPSQARELRNSHFLIKLPYVYAFFTLVLANYFFVSAITGFKILPPTRILFSFLCIKEYFDSALVLGFGAYLFMWAIVCFTLGHQESRMFLYTLCASLFLLLNGVYWIDYISQNIVSLTVICSTIWVPFIIAKGVIPSIKFTLPYLFFSSSVIVCCLTGTTFVLSRHYRYHITQTWFYMPLVTYGEMLFLLFMETWVWKRVRRALRKVFGPTGYVVYTAQQKEETPVQENSCPICLNNYDSVEFVKTPCGHVYHYFCLEEWLKQKAECPTCRKYLPPIEDA